MEKEKFEQAKEIKSKLEQKEQKIRHIDKLLKSCGLECKIDGTPANRHTRLGAYVSYNKDFIRALLIKDREILLSEIDLLNNQFNLL